MISGFPEEMNRWMNEHPLEKKEDLDQMEKFIKKHILMIS